MVNPLCDCRWKACRGAVAILLEAADLRVEVVELVRRARVAALAAVAITVGS